MRYACFSFLAAMLMGVVFAEPAAAVVQFYIVFKEEYLNNHPDQEYAAALNKGTDKCYVCHQGKKRKNHNEFGIHLVELLDRKTDLKDKEKIKAALAKVVAMHVDPNDDKSETFADRIKASKWPGGELEDAKKEPAQDAAESTDTAGN